MNVLWLDLETTGLDPNTCGILELSVVITDDKFKNIGEYSRVLKDNLVGMNDYCTKMHESSGLLEEVRTSTCTKTQAQLEVLNFIKPYFPSDRKPVMAGNSIGFDRSFIKVHLPLLDRAMHYRMIDVSSMYEFLRTFCAREFPKHEGKHRGLSDVKDSIALAKTIAQDYRKLLNEAGFPVESL